MAWGSTVPAALDGIVAALASCGVDVVKGPVVGNSARKEVILVGWDDVNDVPSVLMELSDFEVGRGRQFERYAVTGVVIVASGSTSLDPFIARAFEVLGYVGGALTSDSKLGGAVTDAKLAHWSLDLSQVATGAVVRIPFTVAVQALTSR